MEQRLQMLKSALRKDEPKEIKGRLVLFVHCSKFTFFVVAPTPYGMQVPYP